MKQCLHCKKEFKPKKPTRKYCSDSCRVMYCRTHKVKGLSAEAKMTILYNNFIEAIDEFKKDINTNGSAVVLKKEEIPLNLKQTLIRSAEAWHSLKRECVSAEEWADLKDQIENAENLSIRQKQFIINTP